MTGSTAHQSSAPAPRLRIHLIGDNPNWTMCGGRHAARTTDNPAEVTCQLCLNRLNEDLAPPEESARVRRTAKQWARSRALGRLVEAHRDEFEALIAEELPAATDEAVELEYRMRARLDGHLDHRSGPATNESPVA